jgi:uncharacterized protein YlxW (UPF0749 family)
MNEQDLKYMVSTYQQKTFDLLSQVIATESKVRQLTDLVQAQSKQIQSQTEEIEKLKSKDSSPRTKKSSAEKISGEEF